MPVMNSYGCYDVERGGQGEQFWERADCQERWVDTENDRDLRGGRRGCGYWCWCWCGGCWRWCWCSGCCRCGLR